MKSIYYLPHPLNPPLLQRRGGEIIREAKPLFGLTLPEEIIQGSLRGAGAPLFKMFPFPLSRGRGERG